jgi:hypothetical protein
MLREFVINRGIDIAVWRSQRGEYPLTPTGKRNYKTFINGLKKGIPMNLSEHIGILDGYDYTSGVTGLENLEGLNLNKGCLILANHERELPLKGRSIIFPIGFHVRQKGGKEIRWVYGTDLSLDQFGKGGYEKSLNFILVGGKNLFGRKKTQIKGMRELLQAIKKDFVGLYPEGDNSDKLLKGKSEAGRIIAQAASQKVDIICSTTRLNGRTFEVTFQKLENERVLELYEQTNDTIESAAQAKSVAGQNVVDYAMNTIALPLPPEKRGHYQNPEQALGV